MSNRTSEANKAIALAWAKEQQLVFEGKGRRDWSPEQQQDILDRGKAYSDDGKAFEGHHMKSAEKFLEYQGDPENIQFLSRPEHFVAHDGNFQNFINGYFDPDTGKTSDFGSNKYEPCEILELSEPIKSTGGQTQDAVEDTYSPSNISEVDVNTDVPISAGLKNSNKSGFSGTVKRLGGKVVKFYFRHKDVIKPLAVLGISTFIGELVRETVYRPPESWREQ